MEGVTALPTHIVIEGTKESAKQGGGRHRPGANGASIESIGPLYDGPGPHRVSGTLDEPV